MSFRNSVRNSVGRVLVHSFSISHLHFLPFFFKHYFVVPSQAQLAQKTTLLSEARLKEQEYQEKVGDQ